jgi:hypothetical protein
VVVESRRRGESLPDGTVAGDDGREVALLGAVFRHRLDHGDGVTDEEGLHTGLLRRQTLGGIDGAEYGDLSHVASVIPYFEPTSLSGASSSWHAGDSAQ